MSSIIKRSASFDPYLLGVAAGAICACGYTGANICLRWVAVECDPIFVSFIKAIPIAFLSGVAVVWQMCFGRISISNRRWIVWLLLTGLMMQLAGNVAFQWALGQIGLALTVPLCMGMLLIGSALFGRVWLGERITSRSSWAILLLLAATTILSFSVSENAAFLRNLPASQMSVWFLACGIVAGCLSGLAFAIGGVAIRRALDDGIALVVPLSIISITGVVVLGVWSLFLGDSMARDVDWNDLSTMFLAGIFNAIAFYALGRALQLLPLLQANLMNVSQVMMCAVAGMVLFDEPLGFAQITGITLTVIGLLFIHRSEA